jgi:diguanylate cyclase (GGDEF)-like protein/hemerythrin-like metal-binding protein/PAS domain S-box-containing protein
MIDDTRLHAYLDSSPDGILVADLDGRIEYVSRQGVALLGQTASAAIVGRSLDDFVVEADRAMVHEMLRQLHGGPSVIRIVRNGQPALWAEINAERLGEGDRSVVLVARDASRRKAVEEELVAAKRAAEEATERLQRAFQDLEKLAATDKLTGMWNRRHFEHAAGVEIARCRRYSQIVSLVLLDVDRFKLVNDQFGHDAGDRVLVALAQAIGLSLRGSDSAARWGGEEFVVLLPSVAAAGALRAADRLRERVEQIELPGPPGSVRVSAGVAQLGPTEDLDQWFKRADQALYRAKENGRNRVELSASPSDTPDHRVVQLVWDPDYECGDPLIDGQHRQLFLLANALMDESMSEGSLDVRRQRLSALLDHVVQHFADEERMLERIGYSGLAQHQLLHGALTDEALRLRARLDVGELGLQELVQFLVVRVVRDHLLRSDTLFFPAVEAARVG